VLTGLIGTLKIVSFKVVVSTIGLDLKNKFKDCFKIFLLCKMMLETKQLF